MSDQTPTAEVDLRVGGHLRARVSSLTSHTDIDLGLMRKRPDTFSLD